MVVEALATAGSATRARRTGSMPAASRPGSRRFCCAVRKSTAGVITVAIRSRSWGFRCAVGHAHTADTLLATQSRDVEHALWVAFRTNRERASLLRRMAQDAGQRHQRKAAKMLTKVLGSAIANATENEKADADKLVVTSVSIDGGPVSKRWMARSMGRANRILSRTSHVTVVVDVPES